ncbi:MULTISPECIES: aldehyde reductase [unclassified Cryobacterium]|uniref:SDR family oxidoreductase n=1 Tax=unclassified Cryobacterium TaxID=2649013 RepID=UPI00106C7E69|nr:MULTISPECIES: aldehyde reductase [unclassified Cryobacterium]TFB95845.1 aldehyde reductase [Cryobacterium sp. MDB2-A-1]TFC02594.1 aldehyde reductase [Cryobacterium sp. MDB2-33-2]TFC12158.1 aldehyde reductase [Cryobacterium sp. MDB2-A-2]TFC16049.1 aldehyde reductase [Cryobacterium sp. MDB2-10]
MSGELVLVTGGSGFVGAHCIVRLLADGYRVRTTVRSLTREPEVRAMVAAGGADAGSALSFTVADLLSDAGWAEAVNGCAFVLHVASPFPAREPADEDELIVPARDGALRVLRAARDAGVRRVVLTSSFAAVGYGAQHPDRPFTEDDWTDPTASVSAYVRSKTIAERAAWDFVDREGGTLELTVINPVGIFGPVLGTDLSSSVELLRGLLTGAVPAVPRIETNIVDVRDVADLHLRAMTSPLAPGERFLAVAGPPMTFPEIAALLRSNLGDVASRVPRRVMPTWLVRVLAPFSAPLRQVAPQLGTTRNASHDKARRMLGWEPLSNEEAILATAESLVRLRLL